MSDVPAEVTEEISSDEVNWQDMAPELDTAEEGESVTVEGDVEVAEPAEPPTPQTEPSAEPSAVPPPAAEDTPPPAQEPPAEPQVRYDEVRAKQIEALAARYAFDEETADRLMTEPDKVLPQLAARLHMDVAEAVLRSVMLALPQWIDAHMGMKGRESEAERIFFEANPDLRDAKYRDAILMMGQTFRSMNPSAPAEEAVKVIGAMVRAAFGLQQPQRQMPSAPAPFTPVRGGGGTAAPAPKQVNPWAELAEEFLDE